MKRMLLITDDNSHTISIPELNATYHSLKGAIQESRHIYLDAGLKYFIDNNPKQSINIFEMGFGTGLNSFLTLLESIKSDRNFFYQSVELFPLLKEEYSLLNYQQLLDNPCNFLQLHEIDWEKKYQITPNFSLLKTNQSFLTFKFTQNFDIVYYDAFAYNTQPELWSEVIFKKVYENLNIGGILVTYSSKSLVRKAMVAAGFKVEKIPGPKGKSEIVRALK